MLYSIIKIFIWHKYSASYLSYYINSSKLFWSWNCNIKSMFSLSLSLSLSLFLSLCLSLLKFNMEILNLNLKVRLNGREQGSVHNIEIYLVQESIYIEILLLVKNWWNLRDCDLIYLLVPKLKSNGNWVN